MKPFKAGSIFVCLLSLSACGPPTAPLNFYPTGIGVSPNKLDAEVRSITVAPANPDQATGKIDSGIDTFAMWKDSIERTLNQMVIFRDDSQRKVSIAVTVRKLYVPMGPFGPTAEVDAVYEIFDRKDGRSLFKKEITTSYTVPFTYAFSAFTRAREAANRSVQENILQFSQALLSASF